MCVIKLWLSKEGTMQGIFIPLGQHTVLTAFEFLLPLLFFGSYFLCLCQTLISMCNSTT